ncbi:methylated-DNA--[protein]-cysteine S-methyltransferase [Polyangium sp. y55x31]|uniref:methylated-DNA--[protein]-cysteine S-methyltransferase n=1 Tax=Polyangium sp. y55x31 TaxID=3042688 RepID=UPI0024825659|nr:methylated-DNA--[protein]-cysteine S-methyltransferase [Polyangium sp. y55x31]MDI1483334.1 methylated-DNA--[protein]-cysteine S-methyltransferase [Polyangium sp. y55x31]
MSLLHERRISSPLGELHVVASDEAIVGVYLPGHKGAPVIVARDGREHPVLGEAARQLAEYFAGKRKFFMLPLEPRGSDFQREVWRALLEIPFGKTQSYADLARALGRPQAARAVGAANAKNPISIIVPCHRVIAGDGALTGYAGGITAKRWLLSHEQERHAPHPTIH